MSFMRHLPKTSLASGNFGYYNSPKNPAPTSATPTKALYPPPKLRKPSKKNRNAEFDIENVFKLLGTTLSQTLSTTDDREDVFDESMLFSPTRDPPQAYASKSSNAPDHTVKPVIDTEAFDLIAVDLHVRDYLSSKITKVPQLQKDLMRMLNVLRSKESDVTQKILAKEQSSILRRSIKDLESTMEYAHYEYVSSQIIEEYFDIVKCTKTNAFLINKTKEDLAKEKRLQELRDSYLGACREHLDVRIQKKKVHRPLVCGQCGCGNMKVNIDDDSLYVCSECYAEEEIVIDAPSFKDTDRVNLTSKYTYTRKGHFIDASKRVQGTQNVDPVKIERALDIIRAEMRHHNLVAEQGYVNSVTPDNVHTFLTEQSLSAHYDDLQLLYSMITGVPCIDISEYMDDLLSDFELLEDALEKIKDESRVNSLNVYFKLCALLQRRGFKCKKADFYILKTKTKEDEHNEKLEQAYKLLGWDWKPII